MTDASPEWLVGALLDAAGVGISILDADARYLYANERIAAINGAPAERHLGRTLDEMIPDIAGVVAAAHAEVLRTGAPIRDAHMRGSTPGTPDRTWLVSYMPLEFEGTPAVGAIVLDVTERQRRVRQHAAVADLGQRALAGVNLETLLFAASDTVREELGADQSGVARFTPERDGLVLCAGSGWVDSALGMTSELGRKSQAGFTLLTGAPVVSDDLTTEARFLVSEGIDRVGARSTISTPIVGSEEPYGVLGVFSSRPGHFTDDDAAFVRAVANVLGAAVVRDEQAHRLTELSAQRGRLIAQALDAGEREQRQVADVLHDDVLQHVLFARQELEEGDGDAASRERARASLDAAGALLRRVVAGLHPVTLAHAGLGAALESLAGEHEERGGLRTEVHVDRGAAGRYDRLVVSLVRELLVNVAKHAEAERARVEVRLADGDLTVTVCDDGRGMPDDSFESALAHGNIGLAIARERVEALGGRAAVCEGLDGRGTGVQIRLPH